ncbi:MAG: hypothetical protein ACPGFB_03105 [Verrucomicrobiales bacterium]
MSRPKFRKRELHPEVAAIVNNSKTDRPFSEADWRFSNGIFGRPINPHLARSFAEAKQGLTADMDEEIHKLTFRLINNADVHKEEIREIAKARIESQKESFATLQKAFTAAIIFNDSVFFEDLAILNEAITNDPSVVVRVDEYFKYATAILILEMHGKELTAGNVRSVFEEEFGAPEDHDTIRNRLKRYFDLI